MTTFLRITVILGLALTLFGCESEPYDPDTHDIPLESDPADWVLKWEDNFDGAEGESPSAANWTFDIGNGDNGWGNGQLEYDTDRPENVSLDGQGNLRITAREEAYEGFDYTSGRIKTEGLFAQRYGRFEANIQLPLGQGIWPAFWMLGDDFRTVGWPQCGEIDIMEYRGQAPNVANGAIHGPGYSGGQALSGSYTREGAGFNEGFHIFAVDWTPTSITWSVDGVTYLTIGLESLPDGTEWVYDHPFFLILNVAVGGSYVGDPNQSTQFPQTMLVDYVRVYGPE